MTTLMLALTFSTGVVDAVGFLGLDRVFVGNMTGNVVILGMALTGTADLPVLGPALALVGFMAGAAVAGRLTRPGWTPRTTVALLLQAAMITATAVLVLVVGDALTHGAMVAITTTLGAAMGIQAAAARHVGVKDVTTVVVTSTITGLSADLRWGRAHARDAGRRLSAVGLMLVGATAGAALLPWHPGAGLGLSALITLVVAVVGHRNQRAAERAAA